MCVITVDSYDTQEVIEQEKVYFNEEFLKLNGDSHPELDSFGYLSLFTNSDGGLSVRVISKGDHLYNLILVGSGSYIFLGKLIEACRHQCNNFTPQQFYEWYIQMKPFFKDKYENNKTTE